MTASASRYCTGCGRPMTDSRGGTVCPMCEQAALDAEAYSADPARLEAQAAPPQVPVQPVAQPGPYQNPAHYQPYPQQQAAYVPPPALATPRAVGLPPEVQREVSSIASLEQISAVVWLVIGIIQVLALATALVGIWNIVVSTSRFRRRREIEELHPGIPRAVQGEMGWIIFFIVLNVLFGGIIGVAGAVIDIFIRDRILKVRWAFEQPQPAPVDR